MKKLFLVTVSCSVIIAIVSIFTRDYRPNGFPLQFMIGFVFGITYYGILRFTILSMDKENDATQSND